MIENLVKERKALEELKSKKQRVEERLKVIEEQKVQLVDECRKLNIKPEDLESEIAKVGTEIQSLYTQAQTILGELNV